ncbi:MAG: hypothetical protein QXP81_10015 [Nitrososphaerota archaeon]
MRSVPPRRYLIGPVVAIRGSGIRRQRGLLHMRFPDGTVRSAHISSVQRAYICDGGIALLIESRASDYYRWLPRNPRVIRRIAAFGDYYCSECKSTSYSLRCDCGGAAVPRILWRDPSAVTSFARAELRNGAVVVQGIRLTPWEVLGMYRDETGALYAEVIHFRDFGARPVGLLLPVPYRRPVVVKV